MKKILIISIFTSLIASVSFAAPIKILFVGNSFTYSPGEVANPSLPKNFKAIANALDVDVHVEYVGRGGQTLKGHFDEGKVANKLSSNNYHYVVVQPYSIEALELPKCFLRQGGPVGRSEFLEFADKLISLIEENGATPVLFENWIYQKDHPWLKDNFMCLKFDHDEPNAGQKWFGDNLTDYQNKLDEGFDMVATSNPKIIQSQIGTNWQKIIPNSHLYEADGYHPTNAGSFFSAMILARDVLKLNMTELNEHPKEIKKHEFETMKNVLSQ